MKFKNSKEMEEYVLKQFYFTIRAYKGRINPPISEGVEIAIQSQIKDVKLQQLLLLGFKTKIMENIKKLQCWYGGNFEYVCYTQNFETALAEYYRELEMLQKKLNTQGKKSIK